MHYFCSRKIRPWYLGDFISSLWASEIRFFDWVLLWPSRSIVPCLCVTEYSCTLPAARPCRAPPILQLTEPGGVLLLALRGGRNGALHYWPHDHHHGAQLMSCEEGENVRPQWTAGCYQQGPETPHTGGRLWYNGLKMSERHRGL